MTKINKILAVFGVMTLALGSFVVLSSKASAKDGSDDNEMTRQEDGRSNDDSMDDDDDDSSINATSTDDRDDDDSNKIKSDDRGRGNSTSSNATSSKDRDNDDDSDNSDDDSDDNGKGDEHRSVVAKFVEDLHRIASSTSRGIGDQVREVARSQNDDSQKTSDKLKEVESRSGFLKFLIGVNEDSIAELENSVVTMQNHIDELNKIKATATLDVQKSLDAEIALLTAEKNRVQSVIDKNKDSSGLFGWLFRLFQ